MSFNTTKYLIFDKPKSELDSELLSEFNPWLTTRTFSFYNDGAMVGYINDTLNRYSQIFPTKEEQFKFFENVIPKQKRKRISYIKKPKAKPQEVERIPEFYSRKEFDMLNNMSKYLHD